MENYLTPYQSVISEIKSIISSGQEAAYSASSKAMLTCWNIGKRIVEQELGGSERAEYGRGLISALADDLTKEFGKNYSKRNLHYYIKFYQCFPDEQIVNACVHNLNRTHIRSHLRVTDEKMINTEMFLAIRMKIDRLLKITNEYQFYDLMMAIYCFNLCIIIDLFWNPVWH